MKRHQPEDALSRFRDRSKTLSVGARAPSFRLPTAAGASLATEDLRGRWSLLIFIRGTWCPNCRAQMARLAADWDEFVKRDVAVVLIAAQKIDGMLRARKFVQTHAYPFPILFDQTRRVVRDYGVFRLAGVDAFRIAHPAIFLLDPELTVRWIAISPNQFERPTTLEILEIIESVSGS